MGPEIAEWPNARLVVELLDEEVKWTRLAEQSKDKTSKMKVMF